MFELAILDRLSRSPYSRPLLWEDDVVIGIVAEDERYTVRTRRGLPSVMPEEDTDVDGRVECSLDDLDRMLARRPPESGVRGTLGPRAGPDWRKQARLLLFLATLGWAGPWPDPEAPQTGLYRGAVFDLAFGRADGYTPLFGEGAPFSEITVRMRDGAGSVQLLTEGLWETAGIELSTRIAARGDPRVAIRRLRAGALATQEGPLPAHLVLGEESLPVRVDPGLRSGLPLPRGLGWVMAIG